MNNPRTNRRTNILLIKGKARGMHEQTNGLKHYVSSSSKKPVPEFIQLVIECLKIRWFFCIQIEISDKEYFRRILTMLITIIRKNSGPEVSFYIYIRLSRTFTSFTHTHRKRKQKSCIRTNSSHFHLIELSIQYNFLKVHD